VGINRALKLETPVYHNTVDHLDKSERTFLDKICRLSSEILAHSLGMLANTQLKNKPLQLEHVITV